jgi:hypothetical protein
MAAVWPGFSARAASEGIEPHRLQTVNRPAGPTTAARLAARPGSGGQQPPRSKCASATMCSGSRKPKAMRCRTRSFVFVLSAGALRQAMRMSSATVDLGAWLASEPGDLDVEVSRVPRPVAGPGHLGGRGPMRRAVDTGRCSLQVAAHGTEIERPPPAASLALVIPRSPNPTDPAAALGRSPWVR